MLEIGALAVSALIQGARIAAAEGTSEALGFASGSELDEMRLTGQLRSLASFDEAALVAPVVRLLRAMLLDAVRDIHANANPLADHLVVNVHRSVCQSHTQIPPSLFIALTFGTTTVVTFGRTIVTALG